jgi:hypothetical protein
MRVSYICYLLHLGVAFVKSNVGNCLCMCVMMCVCMGRRPSPAVRDFNRDGRRNTYDVNVRKKMGGEYAQRQDQDRTPSKATITNKSRQAGSFSSS